MDSKRWAEVAVMASNVFDRAFTYQWPWEGLPERGTVVKVPFRTKTCWGVVQRMVETRPDFACKPVLERASLAFSNAFTTFLERSAAYTATPLGAFLQAALGKNPDFSKSCTSAFPAYPQMEGRCVLSQEQTTVLNTWAGAQGFSATLLQGVTGSGKTETALHTVEQVLAKGLQVLILVPEIGLTGGWDERFFTYFKRRLAVWHSNTSSAKKRKIRNAVWLGTEPVLLGARSAVFLPFRRLGLVIVDEAHDSSYKQEEGARYNGRDLAVARARAENVPVVLVSATPTLDMRVQAQRGVYRSMMLASRYQNARMAVVKTIDLRTQPRIKDAWISPFLAVQAMETVQRGEQVLFFINRRGHAQMVFCALCQYKITCDACSTALVFYKQANLLKCHHCEHERALSPLCPKCLVETTWIYWGAGVERLAEEAQALMPEARVVMLSGDDTPAVLNERLERVRKGEVDIIVGTQMVAKGHHFPLLTCVGVVDGDASLWGTDPRAAERTHELLHQVSGRAGRDVRYPGTVWIQTHQPDHPLFKALEEGDDRLFWQNESALRESGMLPPFGRLASLILSGKSEEQVEKFAQDLARTARFYEPFVLLGPTPAVLTRLRGLYRTRFLLKGPAHIALAGPMRLWLASHPLPTGVLATIDVDPQSFL